MILARILRRVESLLILVIAWDVVVWLTGRRAPLRFRFARRGAPR